MWVKTCYFTSSDAWGYNTMAQSCAETSGWLEDQPRNHSLINLAYIYIYIYIYIWYMWLQTVLIASTKRVESGKHVMGLVFQQFLFCHTLVCHDIFLKQFMACQQVSWSSPAFDRAAYRLHHRHNLNLGKLWIIWGASINGGTPKWMVYNWQYHENRWFGVLLFQEISISLTWKVRLFAWENSPKPNHESRGSSEVRPIYQAQSSLGCREMKHIALSKNTQVLHIYSHSK